MTLPQLSPASQRLALLSVSTPPAEAIFFHQAAALLQAGLSTREELDYAAGCVPRKGPFLFIPEQRISSTAILLSAIAAAYRAGLASRVDINKDLTIRHVPMPGMGYFITDYDETLQPHKVSAAERTMAFMASQRSPLTMMELGYRLLYFPNALGEMQFAAAGSVIERGEEDSHVPVFSLPEGSESDTLILSSFLREHHSGCTLFPSCKERVRVPGIRRVS